MIIEDQSITDLTIGSDRRTIQDGDSQVTVPSIIMPVGLTLKPTASSPAAGTIQRGSAMKTNNFESNNAALQLTTILTLGKGIWELEYHLSYIADFKQPVGIASLGCRLLLNYRSNNFTLIQAFIDNSVFFAYGRCRVLFDTDGAAIQHETMATTVAQNIGTTSWLNAIKVI